MRPYRGVLQRCLGSTFHTPAVVIAAFNVPRRNKMSAGRSASTVVEIDGEEFRPTEYAYGTAARTSTRRRRTPAQLLTDLKGPHRQQGKGIAAVEAVNPVELLLQKHDVRGGDGGGGGGDDSGDDHGGSSSSGSRGSRGGGGGRRGRAKRAPLTPPTKAETVAAAAAAAATSAHMRSDKMNKTIKKKTAQPDEAKEKGVEVRADRTSAKTTSSGPTAAARASTTTTATAAGDDYQTSLQILTNPFRGLHGDVARSYRIDQLLEDSTPEDVMLARQERKSTAFSFLRFKAGENFYKAHWASLPEVQNQLDHTLRASPPARGSANATTPYVRGTPIPGLTLFNNDLGLQNPFVQCSYPLILAQRMLLFPDHLRQFHAICGRENVPCDFFADIDLPGESAAGAETALLEVLNYLEVRLPGVGFTDPFFLVLTNAVPGRDKVSYHVHARSMSYLQERQRRAEHGIGLEGDSSKSKSASKSRKGKKNTAASAHDEDEAEMESEGDEYDDLSDMVNVVDNSSASGKKGSGGLTRLVAFQDYRTVKLIGDEVNQTLGRDVIDTNCYRPNGMLRCAFSSKLPSAQDHDFHAQKQQEGHGAAAAAARKRLVPLVTAGDPALQKRLTEMEAVLRTMTDPEILEMTFCTRHTDHDGKVQRLLHEHAKKLVILDSHAPAGSEAQRRSAAVLQATLKHRWKLIRPRHILGPQAAQAVEYDAYGNVVSPFLTEGAKWRRYKAVTAKLRKLPPRAAESYDVWVRVGLALHNFSNEDNCFEEWVLFSLKSPQKYSREVCRKKWMQFERNPDALNWRRGYNYLNSTVWRQV
ncbi:putative mitochondrial primase 2 [Leptomonas pyrrhocoris]|uniref:Putative mitochondrial primase 2 n=1 Tax=Leptomonas pyrrhocoris TaxID=157538 RepID=A0A0M9FTG0_LEPPY|nr:putative mitochondrial primase 2 [Leptomonas pyrrhocoris]KPA75730.1 putative mitochondrial primase 2 [Leptomonas pyrrhocoris]|eukprot:XP_015654169.1 putative mitochondrial primase 2 [Leptomonas pyrrhocoris]